MRDWDKPSEHEHSVGPTTPHYLMLCGILLALTATGRLKLWQAQHATMMPSIIRPLGAHLQTVPFTLQRHVPPFNIKGQRVINMDSLVCHAFQKLQKKEASQEAVGASQQDDFRLGGQLRGRDGRGRAGHVGLGQKSFQPQIGDADCLRVAAVHALESRTLRFPATVYTTIMYAVNWVL